MSDEQPLTGLARRERTGRQKRAIGIKKRVVDAPKV